MTRSLLLSVPYRFEVNLRILLLMDPYIKVPPEHYGGIERVIADLAEGLHARGHEVTLWAAPGSKTSGKLEPFGREGEWTQWSNIRNAALLTARFWRDRGKFDVIHNFGRLAYLTSVLRWDVPKVQSYQRAMNPNNMRFVQRLGARRLHFTAVSKAQRDTGSPGGGDWSVIYNCVPMHVYQFNGDVDPTTAPLAFLGRLEPIKGVHNAIAVAKAAKRRLVIAGNRVETGSAAGYFASQIQPHLDGEQIRYVGPVNDTQKNELLGNAAAFLMPIEWEEPFGIVMAEALACGTPVLGFRRGSVPEVIRDAVTGFLSQTPDEMAAQILRLHELDRHECRREAERRFSDAAIVDEYESLYRMLLAKEE